MARKGPANRSEERAVALGSQRGPGASLNGASTSRLGEALERRGELTASAAKVHIQQVAVKAQVHQALQLQNDALVGSFFSEHLWRARNDFLRAGMDFLMVMFGSPKRTLMTRPALFRT